MKPLLTIAAVIACSISVLADCNAKGLPTFSQFPAGSLFKGEIHAPVLKTRLDRRFPTAIRFAMKDGVNFGGHYVVASWGCGTGCMQFVVVDAITGTVYDTPFYWVNFHYSLGANARWPSFDATNKWWCEKYQGWPSFRTDSTLIVVEGCIADRQCGRTFYNITESGLKQVHFDPDLLPNGKVAAP